MTEKQKQIEYTMKVLVVGYADDIAFFQEVADDEMKSLWKEVTSVRVCKDGVIRSSSVKIKKSKIVSRQIL